MVVYIVNFTKFRIILKTYFGVFSDSKIKEGRKEGIREPGREGRQEGRRAGEKEGRKEGRGGR